MGTLCMHLNEVVYSPSVTKSEMAYTYSYIPLPCEPIVYRLHPTALSEALLENIYQKL